MMLDDVIVIVADDDGGVNDITMTITMIVTSLTLQALISLMIQISSIIMMMTI